MTSLPASSRASSAARSADAAEDLPPGEVLGGKYRVVGVRGRGGMSIVYEAQHVQLGHHVAIKLLRHDASAGPRAFERIFVEARAAARLSSEHVVRVHDVGVASDGAPFVVMEMLAGRDLARELEARGSFAIGEAVGLVLQACEALAEAHAAGLVHRDIKPSNVFLTTRPDGTPCVKVLDFGLVQTSAPNASKRRSAGGSPGYASPEQLGTKEDVDPRADVWGIGVMLYELLSGKRPFEASTLSEGLLEIVSRAAPPLSSPHGPMPEALARAVEKCLEREREDRFASIAELAAAIAPFAAPPFADYARRVREVSMRAARPSANTVRILPAESEAPLSAASGSGSLGSSMITDADAPRAAAGVSPLVVAHVVGPGRTAARWALFVLGVALLVAVAFVVRSRAMRTAEDAPSATPSVQAQAGPPVVAPSTPSGLALLPPLPEPTATADVAAKPVAPSRASASARGTRGAAPAKPGPRSQPPSADPMTYR